MCLPCNSAKRFRTGRDLLAGLGHVGVIPGRCLACEHPAFSVAPGRVGSRTQGGSGSWLACWGGAPGHRHAGGAGSVPRHDGAGISSTRSVSSGSRPAPEGRRSAERAVALGSDSVERDEEEGVRQLRALLLPQPRREPGAAWPAPPVQSPRLPARPGPRRRGTAQQRSGSEIRAVWLSWSLRWSCRQKKPTFKTRQPFAKQKQLAQLIKH